ncbi:ABC transporter ATP-binding protein [Leptospira sp. GIMC2001]|uniref:ABC transporter ATP-binding protein n=1 Tax=Leptospira sp. GIMC2001 TaxID=1513297 RepID=UPI00234A4739|nr:ATP-binding cassette domain-containing protein [Leptospira sp. GIMC2001]WCL48426.1 ATP-binding cassette domain-containing protein [Leptospira sp. GIMC2001]
MLIVDNLTKYYGKKKAIDGISFRLERGRITGLLGPNGAGKTTTMRIMTGFLDANEGSVTYDSDSISASPMEIKKRLGYLPENAPLYPEMLVCEYLKFLTEARSIPLENKKAAMDRVVDLCDLRSHFYHPIGQLSKGFKQRVSIAGTLIHDPDYIILDEPSSGLDPNQINEIRNLIKKLGKEKTVILSTHILQEVVEVCDHVLILSQGKIVLDSPVAGLGETELVYFVTKSGLMQIAPFFTDTGMDSLEKVDDLPNGYFGYVVNSNGKGSEAVFEVLKKSGKSVSELRTYEKSMEMIFSDLTKSKGGF